MFEIKAETVHKVVNAGCIPYNYLGKHTASIEITGRHQRNCLSTSLGIKEIACQPVCSITKY
jgi:hypothetical protein